MNQKYAANENQANYFPVMRTIPADLDTPVGIYLKVRNHTPSFLLESVSGGEQIARYSFIGVNPREIFSLKSGILSQISNGETIEYHIKPGGNPFDILRERMASFVPSNQPGVPRFIGGLVGYIGYEFVRYFEGRLVKSLSQKTELLGLPEAIFLLSETLIAYDHAYQKILLITNVQLNENMTQEDMLAEGNKRLDYLEMTIKSQLPKHREHSIEEHSDQEIVSNTSHDEFIESVNKAKEYIAAGDIFQVVLSQRFSKTSHSDSFDIYRSLRRLNPSPYMFFFDFSTIATDIPYHLIGASPEMHVRLENQCSSLRPIAGTRPRGKTYQEDIQLKNELLDDPKERAEHVMLVDLARNDLGRVCSYGSVGVSELMKVENYSHVMHIVSQVDGEILPEYDCFDLMKATFPAGTVSGAPKIRAMEIIAELEKEARGPYAGAVGYFSFDGSMDTCITIRSLMKLGDKVYFQSGAGIVADSIPENEYLETVNKAKALSEAIDQAAEGN